MARTRLESSLPVSINERLLAPLERFLHVEAASGIVLLVAAAVALIWANSPWHSTYDAVWHAPIEIRIGGWLIAQPLHYWINEGLMTVFFLVVGLEIRREMHEGTLATVQQATLPLAAALGGVAVPALIYLGISDDATTRRGWAVPTATDIAFAVGVLALLGPRVPHALRVLLLALAIVDDVAAILIIALVYSAGIELSGIAIAIAGVLGVVLFQRFGVRSAWPYVLPGAILWAGLLRAGLHPTLAGVVLGLMTPVTGRGHASVIDEATLALGELGERTRHRALDMKSILQPFQALKRANRDLIPAVIRVEMNLHGWVAFGVMPLFALANAGVYVDGVSWSEPGVTAVFVACTLGLVVGKPIGVLAGAYLAVRLGLCALPRNVNWRGIALIGALAGIGFTMAIFIANLAFESGRLLSASKLGVLVASGIAAAVGLVAGSLMFGPRSAAPADDGSPEGRNA